MAINLDLLNRGLQAASFRVQVAAPAPRFLQEKVFGGPDILSKNNAEYIVYEYRKLKAGSLVEEGDFGRDPNRVNYAANFDSVVLRTAYYDLVDTISATELDTRLFGEDFNTNKGEYQRAIQLAAEKVEAMRNSVRLHKEKLCADTLLTGKVTLKAMPDGQSMPIALSDVTTSGASLLTAPIKTIQTAVKQLHAINGAASPRCLLMNATDAMNLLTALKDYMDRDTWSIAQARLDAYDGYSVVYDGSVSIPGAGVMEIYHYDATLPLSTGASDVIPQGTAVLLPKGFTIGSMGYARILSNQNGLGFGVAKTAPEYYETFAEGEGSHSVLKVGYQSAPLPIITSLYGYGLISSIPSK